MTSGDRSLQLTEQPALHSRARPLEEGTTVTIDASQLRQEMVGFGAAITDSTAWLVQTRMSQPQREAFIRELFGRENAGLGFSFTRITIGASDFSRDHYSLADSADPTLSSFSTARMQEYVFPTLKAALNVNPDLKVMATPWSAPAWMKTSGSLIKGQLKSEHYGTYAEYLTRYILEADKMGIPTDYLSIQNEPDYEPDTYPGMRWGPAGRALFIGQHLGPTLRAHNITTQILDWDHNWDLPHQPLDVLSDPIARAEISGVAWHCYAGEVDAQTTVRTVWPDKDVFFTECSGGGWAPNFSDNLIWKSRNLIIGATRHWSRGVLMWNLALDENHGPHKGGCSDCRGVVTINSQTGAVERNEEYYVFGHASRFVQQGARRIETQSSETLPNVAFLNPDGDRVLLVLNPGQSDVSFLIQEGQQSFRAEMPAQTLATYLWPSAH